MQSRSQTDKQTDRQTVWCCRWHYLRLRLNICHDFACCLQSRRSWALFGDL